MIPTTPLAQQEYIITVEQLDFILGGYGNYAEEVFKTANRIRTRPHTSTPVKSVTLTSIEMALRKEDCPSKNVQWAIEKLNQYQENQEQHDTAIRTATLDELHKMILQEKCFDPNPEKPCTRNYDCVGHVIEILRTQEPTP